MTRGCKYEFYKGSISSEVPTTLLRKLSFSALIVGHGALDPCPEGIVVIGLVEVCHLVNHHVIDKASRKKHGPPVEVECVVGAARSPPVAERAYVHA